MSAAAVTLEAHAPPVARDAVRLLAVGLSPGGVRHARFTELPDLLAPGDLLVVNASATLPASLPARRADGTAVSLNLSTPAAAAGERLTAHAPERWSVELRRAGGRVRDGRPGEELVLPAGGHARLVAPYRGARLWEAELRLPGPLVPYLHAHGEPIRYAHLHGRPPLSEFQTVFAEEEGSAEMPSAGRPFTPAVLARLEERRIGVASIVLHTGVSSLEVGEPPYPERLRVSGATAARVRAARRAGGRVIAVGTTVVRALETGAGPRGAVRAVTGWTDLVLGPRRPARAVDGVLTGFHDAGASHLELLEAVVGRRVLERAARAASGAGYLRHEFGDVQLLIREPRRLAAVPGGARTSGSPGQAIAGA